MTKPKTCTNVKCMQKGCKNEASHKVGEQNIWNKKTESEEYNLFNSGHELTTYLCDQHFGLLMNREEYYKAFHPITIDGEHWRAISWTTAASIAAVSFAK